MFTNLHPGRCLFHEPHSIRSISFSTIRFSSLLTTGLYLVARRSAVKRSVSLHEKFFRNAFPGLSSRAPCKQADEPLLSRPMFRFEKQLCEDKLPQSSPERRLPPAKIKTRRTVVWLLALVFSWFSPYGPGANQAARKNSEPLTAAEELPPAWTSGATEPEPVEPEPETELIEAEKETWDKRALARYRAQGFDPISVLRAQPYKVKEVKSGAACIRELRRLGVDFQPGPNVRGIVTPILLSGDSTVGGIRYRNVYAGRKPLMDCRMALALYRAAPIIRAAGFDTVHYWGFYSYRRVARRRHLSRHAFGMAMDASRFSGGKKINAVVEDDWEKIKGKPGRCVASPKSTNAARLRTMVCRLESLNIFRRILTPDSDFAHRDHFHMSAPFPKETSWKRNRYAGRQLRRKLPGNRRPRPRYRRRRRRRRPGAARRRRRRRRPASKRRKRTPSRKKSK